MQLIVASRLRLEIVTLRETSYVCFKYIIANLEFNVVQKVDSVINDLNLLLLQLSCPNFIPQLCI
jgi:hypothetical protein